jgi:hypothetical protein
VGAEDEASDRKMCNKSTHRRLVVIHTALRRGSRDARWVQHCCRKGSREMDQLLVPGEDEWVRMAQVQACHGKLLEGSANWPQNLTSNVSFLVEREGQLMPPSERGCSSEERGACEQGPLTNIWISELRHQSVWGGMLLPSRR